MPHCSVGDELGLPPPPQKVEKIYDKLWVLKGLNIGTLIKFMFLHKISIPSSNKVNCSNNTSTSFSLSSPAHHRGNWSWGEKREPCWALQFCKTLLTADDDGGGGGDDDRTMLGCAVPAILCWQLMRCMNVRWGMGIVVTRGQSGKCMRAKYKYRANTLYKYKYRQRYKCR